MPRKIRQLKTDLRKAGAYQVSQEGSHTKWKHPLVSASMLILSEKLQRQDGVLSHE